MLLYSPRWLFFYPGLLILLVGILGAAWLLPGPREVGGIQFDVHTLFYFLVCVVLGVQSVMFAVLTNTFAVNHGLLPERTGFKRFRSLFNLEVGLVVSGLLILGGLGGATYAAFDWWQEGLGNLDPSTKMRTVLPSLLAVIVGVQLFFNSFFYSAINLVRE